MVFEINTMMKIYYLDERFHTDDMKSTLRPNQLCFTKFCCVRSFSYFPGDGWGKLEIKDHLSPAEAEIGAELEA